MVHVIACGHRRLIRTARLKPCQRGVDIRFRVDQELPGGDHLFARDNTATNLDTIAGLDADIHGLCTEAPVAKRNDERLAEIPGRPAMLVTKLGEGTVISLIDNPNFRAFWYGTSKLYLNGLFFGSIVEPTSPPGDW